MAEQELLVEEETEIDLTELFQVLKSRYKFILCCIIICTLISGLATHFLIDKKYQAVTRIYPKPTVVEGYVDFSQLNANDKMVNNYVGMLKGNNIQSKVAEKLHVSTSVIKNSTTVSVEPDTQIIAIKAVTTDPYLSKDIVNTLSTTFKDQAKKTLNVGHITTIDKAILDTNPVSPSLVKNVALGGVLGAVLSMGYVVLRFIMDTRIHSKEEAEKYLGIPCLGSIPYFED